MLNFLRPICSSSTSGLPQWLSKFLPIVALWFGLSLNTGAQECHNLNLELGNFTNWLGYTGTCCAINTPNLGIVPGRHTIVTGNGFAPFTCSQLPEVPPGYQFSARLGNSNTGAQAERLTYTVDVTEESTLIVYKYAVVLQDPGHSASQQPRFQAWVRNASNQIIACTSYQVAASQNLPGFQTCGSVVYQNWTTVGVDVSDYIGQTVRLEFATGDCSLGGHFGFAYIVAECHPLQLETRFCLGNTNLASISAPEGFTYLWSNGQTTQTIQIANPQEGQVVWCQITSVTGCVAVLEAVMTPTSTHADFNPIVECTEDAFFDNLSYVQNGIITSVEWISSDGYTTNDFDFSHTFPGPGLYDITLIIISDVDCEDISEQQILIKQSPVADFQDMGVCQGLEVDLTSLAYILSDDTLINSWQHHNDEEISEGDVITLSYAEPGTDTVILTTIASNGCTAQHTGTVTIHPMPQPSFSVANFCEDGQVSVVNASQTFSGNPQYTYSNTPAPFTSNLLTPALSSLASGPQELTLSISEAYGPVTCTVAATEPYIIHAVPEVLFTGEANVCELELISMVNETTVADESQMSFQWLLDNNQMSIGTDYALALPEGIYSLTLNVQTPFGCSGTLTRELRSYPFPDVQILTEVNGCPPFDPGTHAVVTGHWGNEITHAWTLNGASAGDQQYAESALAAAGFYDFVVDVMAGDGLHACPGNATVQVEAFHLPQIAWNPVRTCMRFTTIENLTTLTGPAVLTGYLWESSDGYSTTDLDFEHEYGAVGPYTMSLTAETSDGCTGTEIFPIVVQPNPDVTFFAANPCVNEGLQLTSTATVTSGNPLTVSWSLPDMQLIGEGPVYNPLIPNVGFVDVWHYATSTFGCQDSLLRSIEVYPDPISVPVIPPVCQYSDIAVYNMSVLQTDNYAFTWTMNGASYSTDSLASFSSQLPADGIVRLHVEDFYAEGSCQDALDIPFIVWAVPHAQAEGEFYICSGDTFTAVSTSYTDDNSPFSSSWTLEGSPLSQTTEASATLNTSGEYALALMEVTPFCSDTSYHTVYVYPNPDVLLIPDTAFCVPGGVMAEIIPSGYWGTPSQYYVTMNGEHLFNGPSAYVPFDVPGTYHLEATVLAGDNYRQCPGHDDAWITVWPLPEPAFTWEPERVDEDNPYLTLINMSQNYSGISWNLNGLNLGTSETVNLSLLNYPPGPYPICLTATSPMGCVNVICHILNLIDIPNIYVANAFTPDQDGLNDGFGPSIDNPSLLEYYDFMIMDRWGTVIFSSQNPIEKWNGTHDKNTHIVQNDVYVYLLKYRKNGDSEITRKTGTVTLIR